MAPHASPLVQLGIPLLALAMFALVTWATGKTSGARARALFGRRCGLWLAFSALLGSTGFLANGHGFPPRFALVLVPTLALPILFAFSRAGTALAEAPLALLVLSQSFRLPLELVMHRAALEGTMPEQMTFTGCNFDILTGVTALVVAALAARGQAPRWLLLVWNALGSLLLVAVVAIAVASLPAFGAFGREPERLNTWIAYFPFVWLPAGLVSSAVLGHVLLWRRLLSHAMRGRDFAPVC